MATLPRPIPRSNAGVRSIPRSNLGLSDPRSTGGGPPGRARDILAVRGTIKSRP